MSHVSAMSSSFLHVDEGYMRRALALARRGYGDTAPNPPVGALIIKNSSIVGIGFHPRAGEPHAERFALEMAGERARGATLYVTLEPCNHSGRTGPCTEAILAAGVSRVVYSARDPNAQVKGGGGAFLKTRGVEVTEGICRTAGELLIAPWVKSLTSLQPFVTLKLALTAEGLIAERAEDRSGAVVVSSNASRAQVQRIRAHSDAVAVGIQTVLIDDPLLTNRSGRGKTPRAVIFDSNLRTPPLARIVREGTVIVHGADLEISPQLLELFSQKKVTLLPASRREKGIDLKHALMLLGNLGVRELLIEGGGSVATSLLRSHLVDRIVLYHTPVTLTSDSGLRGVSWHDSGFNIAVEFSQVIARRCGADTLEIYEKRRP